MNLTTQKILEETFKSNGFNLSFSSFGSNIEIPLGKDGFPIKIKLENMNKNLFSTPKTVLSSPKHGKEDSENKPHVGGNQWAGGTGGSDTAGLGGRGGPYRLDKGHQVHQISDEDKALVSEESKRKALEISRF